MSFDGTYAYRFSGFSVRYVFWHLVGVGTMEIKGNDITGFHSATTLQMQGNEATVQVGRFGLTGTWKPIKDSKNEFEATIAFENVEKVNGISKQILDATFAFVAVGDGDRLWMISKTTFNKLANRAALEVVSAEAIRTKIA